MPPSRPPRPHVAFLRGINIGRRRVTMDRLRGLFEGLGLADVSTYLASGNVTFGAATGDAAGLEREVEAHLRRELGYEVPTFVRTPARLAAVAAHRPFDGEGDVPGHTLHVAFLREPPGEALGRLLPSFRTARDDFDLRGAELYWLCRGKVTDSLVGWPRLEKAIGVPSTMRNATTVRGLLAARGWA